VIFVLEYFILTHFVQPRDKPTHIGLTRGEN